MRPGCNSTLVGICVSSSVSSLGRRPMLAALRPLSIPSFSDLHLASPRIQRLFLARHLFSGKPRPWITFLRAALSMADLFSTFAGAVNVAEVCVRLSTYIKKVYQTTKGVDHELDSLSHELISFKDFYTALAQLHAISTAQQKQTSDKTSPDDPCTTLWSRAIELIQEGQNLVGQLERLLGQIQGPGSSESWQKLDHLRKALKILSRDDQYSRIRQRFSYLNLELNTMITAIDL